MWPILATTATAATSGTSTVERCHDHHTCWRGYDRRGHSVDETAGKEAGHCCCCCCCWCYCYCFCRFCCCCCCCCCSV
uniref:Putative secreted protein n=1 Tax=Anopheles darlingi TaxID=43151 RepID=A0A2M4DLK6_ANODA